MSQHNRERHITGIINPIGKKERKRLERQAMARRRMRLHSLLTVWLLCLQNWERALAGTHENLKIEQEVGYFKMQLAKLRKRTNTACRLLGDEWPHKGAQFFQDAQKKIEVMINANIKNLPGETSYFALHTVMTYVCYANLHDLRFSTKEQRPEILSLISAMGQFANHLLPLDSDLLMPMNRTYWDTREMFQEGDPPVNYGCPSEADLWLDAHPNAA